jgi:hypothetical protein
MIRGAHLLLYSKKAERVRAFLRDIVGLKGVDAGEGWLIFGLPPTEVGVHPTLAQEVMEGSNHGRVELHLMCDDIAKTVAVLKRKGVRFTAPVSDRGYGICTAFRLPDGSDMGLYQPRHPTAIPWPGAPKAKRARPARRRSTAAAKGSSRSR